MTLLINVLHTDSSYLAVGYPIKCCGVVKKWNALIAKDNDVQTSLPVTIYFQIWRPVTANQYTLVGQNQFCK